MKRSVTGKPKPILRFKRLNNIFYKLTFVGVITLYLLGYYPAFTFPPVKKSLVQASYQQQHEIIASILDEPILLPHPGYISTRFSSRHQGIDIATGFGMPIHPISSGKVEEVNYSIFGYGNYVIIGHSGGFKSLYAHMGRVYAKKGQNVNSSNIIGEVGMTGYTSGPHTHLEITLNNDYINPETLLPKLADYPD